MLPPCECAIQHAGGHEDRSNMKYFIAWANKQIKHTPPK